MPLIEDHITRIFSNLNQRQISLRLITSGVQPINYYKQFKENDLDYIAALKFNNLLIR